ncbi:hypothetical protein [Streptacidiphilus albus]|uniref:hypothetical protein n=1 Tax=Streptacidiphilus albus TaxID=105425 RepID=UPI00054C19D2|nr:hypothetical protein [Streptacidiphilus albus]
MIPFAEHRPASVSESTWVEYVRLMTAASYGRITPPGVAQLDAIYAQAPEILDAGRELEFGPVPRMTIHPEDAGFLDAQPWAVPGNRPYCDGCGAAAATVPVGLIERGSGAAYEVRNCRFCVATLLWEGRRAAERRRERFTPAIPERARL